MSDEEKSSEKRLARRYRRHVLRERRRPIGWWWAIPELKRPRVDVLDLGDALQVVADMPGVQKEDIKIDVTPQRVEISAESSTETERKEEEYACRERGYASYRRVLDLPAHVLPDRTEASFENGVLELNLPKKEPTVEKRVEIK